jgi:hypothetical protein
MAEEPLVLISALFLKERQRKVAKLDGPGSGNARETLEFHPTLLRRVRARLAGRRFSELEAPQK